MIPRPSVFERAGRLRHGVNLSHWFSQVYRQPGYVPAHFDSYIRVADIALIRDLGFDHVRFPINCAPIIAGASADGTLPAAYLALLREKIDEMLDHSLAVIVDIHPEDDFKHALARSGDAVTVFAGFWRQLAGAFATFDPERVFFEVLNEPCIHDVQTWDRMQARLVSAIREVAPAHTIIINGDQWSLLPDLLALTPPPDDNLIANFHLYDPHIFSHQGARWLGSWTDSAKGLTYPVDPEVVASLTAGVDDAETRRKFADYIAADWTIDTYRDFVRPAVNWAHAHGLPLTCNEFGVYKKYAPRASRLAWLRDVSTALTEAGIGWTMWDYAGDFAVVTREETGALTPDHEVVAALGLQPAVAG